MEGWGIACEQALHLGSRDKSRESPRGFAAHSRGLSRLALLATNGELASRLLEGVGGGGRGERQKRKRARGHKGEDNYSVYWNTQCEPLEEWVNSKSLDEILRCFNSKQT